MEEMECSEEFLELAHKMRAEQEEYRVWLMSQPPEIIIAHSAEWSAREDVLSRLDELVLDGKETKALLSLDKPFEKLFGWLSDEEDPEEIRLEIDAMAEGMARMMAAGC